MDFDKVIEKRRSVHNFKDKKINWKHVLEAIYAGSQTPLAGNISNMKFIIVEDEDIIQKIAKYTDQLWINQAQTVIIVCSEEKHLERMYGERGRIYCRQQAGAAIENVLLKLTDLGLSTCWVGAYNDNEVRFLLKIPKDINIEAIIPIGHEKGKISKKRKRDVENLIYWENWNKKRRSSLIKDENIKEEY